MVKERLESIAEAWSSFVVEFPSCPKIKTDTGEHHQKILFLCAATEKNPAELCFAFFGPQILLRRLHDLNGDETTADARLIFVYAAEVPATLKATLDYSKSIGDVDGWTNWVCGLTDRYSANGRFNSAVAMYAFRQGVRGECLAEAARRAKQLNAAPEDIDSVITTLSSGS